MNQRRNCSHYVYGEKEPWKAFASAVIVQAVKDFRSCGRMQYELRQKFRSETKLTAEERDYLTYRIMQYKQRLDELRIFFQSGRFVVLTDIDGIQLLKRLEREIAVEEITAVVNSMDNQAHRIILLNYYLSHMNFEKIAERIGLSRSRVYHLHAQALDELEMLLSASN